MEVQQSEKLRNVHYSIRGSALILAEQLENNGFQIRKLNTGNTYCFGLEAPAEVINEVVTNIRQAQGYINSNGLVEAREAIAAEQQRIGISGVASTDIYIGNGVSELIGLTTQALLNNGDEILIPCPDYPLWSASTRLSGGIPQFYHCDEQTGWFPDLSDIARKINRNTRAIVVINPNNPTGSVYPREILEGIVELARQHQLIILSDEIYSKITYDDAYTIPMATLADDVLIISYNGLSKSYRLPGFRVGWMVLSGPWQQHQDFITGLNVLVSMRLCPGVPGQFAIKTALQENASLAALIRPGGRLHQQRQLTIKRLAAIPGITCVKPDGALYAFPRLDSRFNISDDTLFIYDLLKAKNILAVQGTGFNLPDPTHFRITFLPHLEDLEKIYDDIADFLQNYRQQ